jgi:protocatechuate 3,4-dioxygenase beta subunit
MDERTARLTRRGLISIAGAGGVAAALAACSPGQIPVATDEAGPFVENLGSNAALYRSDIREGQTGVALTTVLTFVNSNSSTLARIPNLRVDIWQCNKDGVYSGFNNSGVNAVGKTFLRGIQLTNALGTVTFRTIYPGWYAGRITHQHLQLFRGSTVVRTTQLAFPQAVTKAVYASRLYTKGQNTSVSDFAHDHVFSDGVSTQLMTLTGSVTAGYKASLTIGVPL